MADDRPPGDSPDRPPEPPLPPPQPDPEEPDRPADIPESPWRIGTIRNLSADEVLGLAFTGERARSSVGVQLAGQALSSLDDLVNMLAASIYGQVGKRGPAPLPTGIGTLRLSGLEWGSAAFYFSPGEGEAFQLPVDENIAGLSKIEVVVEELMDLVEASPTDDVIEVARRHSDRVATKYVEFLNVVVSENVDLAWQTKSQGPVLSAVGAGRALAVLEQTDHIRIEDMTAEGVLYEANARTRGFRLLQDDGRLVLGRFEEALYVQMGNAWNHRVRAAIRVRVERLARSEEERRTFELVGLQELGLP